MLIDVDLTLSAIATALGVSRDVLLCGRAPPLPSQPDLIAAGVRFFPCASPDVEAAWLNPLPSTADSALIDAVAQMPCPAARTRPAASDEDAAAAPG